MKFEELLSNLKQRKFSPIYLLTGEQNYYIDLISNYIEEEVLSEQEKDFNQTVLYGKDSNVKDIMSLLRKYPMMSEYQVVILKEAQDLSKIEELEVYAKQPAKTTIFVICYKYKKLDGRTAFYKALKKNGVVFEAPRIYDNQLPDWINNYMLKAGYTISPKGAQLLANYLGTDLQKIANELDKLMIVVKKGSRIDVEDIEKHIGISKDFNVFEYQNAIAARDATAAFRIVNYFAENEKAGPMPMVVIMIYQFFVKVMKYHFLRTKDRTTVAAALGINPFFIKDYNLAANNYPPKKVSQVFQLIEEYDLKYKGVDNVSATQGELLKEFTYKLLNL